MAEMVVKAVKTEAEQVEFYLAVCDSDFGCLILQSVWGFSHGSLPGDLGDTPEALDTGAGEERLCGVSASTLQGGSAAPDVRACAGCIQRASCLLIFADMLKQRFTQGSTLSLRWEVLRKVMPMQKFRDLIDQWLLSSGAAAQDSPVSGPCPDWKRPQLGYLTGNANACCAGDAMFDPSTDKQPTLMLPVAMRLMRMLSCCCCNSAGCPEFMQRSGMLLRYLHLLRNIVAACPTTFPVCCTALWALHASVAASALQTLLVS